LGWRKNPKCGLTPATIKIEDEDEDDDDDDDRRTRMLLHTEGLLFDAVSVNLLLCASRRLKSSWRPSPEGNKTR
jgi:hypothetical protein